MVQLEDMLSVLKPFKEVTLFAEKDRIVSIQQSIPLYRITLYKLEEVADPEF